MSRIRLSSPAEVVNSQYQQGPTLFGIVVEFAENYLQSQGFFDALGAASLSIDQLDVRLPFNEDYLSEDYTALEKIGELLGKAILDEARKKPGFELSKAPPRGITTQMNLGPEQKGVAWGEGFFEIDGKRFERYPGADDSGQLTIDRSYSKGKVTWTLTGHRADVDPDVINEDALVELSTNPHVLDPRTGEPIHLFHVHRVYGNSNLPKGLMSAVMAQMVKSEELQTAMDLGTGEKGAKDFDAIEGYVANKPTFALLSKAVDEYGGAENIPQAVLNETKLGKMRANYAKLLGYVVDHHEWHPHEGKLLTFLKRA